MGLQNTSAVNPQDGVLTALPRNGASPNGKNGMKNGVHTNGVSNDCLEPQHMPESFVDAVTMLILDVCVSSIQRGSRLEEDARKILQLLMDSGQVSARMHFKSDLSVLLRQLGPSATDVSIQMLKQCPDVSERQLVEMLGHILSRADVASVVEVASLFEQIIEYSSCNESLLRHALLTLSRDEVRLLMLILVEKVPLSCRLLPWLAALCDTLSCARDQDEASDLSRIQKAITGEISAMATFSSLQRTVQESLDRPTTQDASHSPPASKKRRPSSLPPYQIERLAV